MQEEKKGTEKIIQGSKKGKLLSIVISPPAVKVHCGRTKGCLGQPPKKPGEERNKGHQNMNQGVLRTTTVKAR